jgi:hypothetical protein
MTTEEREIIKSSVLSEIDFAIRFYERIGDFRNAYKMIRKRTLFLIEFTETAHKGR